MLFRLLVGIKEILQDNEKLIITTIITLLITIAIFFWAKKRSSKVAHEIKGENIIIFKILLSTSDFILDGLFIYENGEDVRILFIPRYVI